MNSNTRKSMANVGARGEQGKSPCCISCMTTGAQVHERTVKDSRAVWQVLVKGLHDSDNPLHT